MTAKIAIVGAGPSGCFVAQALLKARPDLNVDVIDRLPVPYGLLRYGVAADHQGTKAVARQFARVFERMGARFFGNVRVGPDVTLDAVRQAYDAVVLATGMAEDRMLDIAGADLPGIYGAARLTRALYDHPEAQDLPDIGPAPLILGQGNVAIDLLRILCKAPEDLAGSDFGPRPSAWLAQTGIKRITIVGRAPAVQAKCDPVMIRELGKLRNVQFRMLGAIQGPVDDPRLHALMDLPTAPGTIEVTFLFGQTPRRVAGDTHVTGLHVSGDDGDGGDRILPASALVTAIGFAPQTGSAIEAAFGGSPRRVGQIGDHLFVAGWLGRGPRGTIPDCRPEAQSIAQTLLATLSPDPTRIGSAVFDSCTDIVDYAGWQRIDAAEVARRPQDRVRHKVASCGELLALAQKEDA